MPPTVNLTARNVPGYGLPDGRCLPCSGVSGKAATASFCLSHGDWIIRPRVKIGTLAWAPKGASFVCKASFSGNKRNQSTSRQKKGGLSRGKNKQDEEEDDSFEDDEEPELDSSKSNKSSYESPGPKEKEIAELFRKVQLQLREGAARKIVEKKVEAPKEESKSSSTVGPLLQLLRKHSLEKGIKGGSIGDLLGLDKSAQNGSVSNGLTRNSYGNKKDFSSFRGQSKFVKKSPIPQEKYNSSGDFDKPVSRWTSSLTGKKYQDDISAAEPEEKPKMESDKSLWTSSGTGKKLEEEPDLDLDSDSESDSEIDFDSEPEPEHETEAVFSDEDVYDEISEDDTEVGDKQELIEEVDLKAMKVPELRELAKARGLKKTSKMKKGELIDLLSSSSV